MKRTLLPLLLLLLLLPILTLAESARDLTEECTLSFRGGEQANLVDRDEISCCTLPQARNHYVTITPGDTPVAGVYVVMGTHQKPFTVQRQTADGDWADITGWNARDRHQEYVTFAPQSGPIRLYFHREDNDSTVLDLRELVVLSAGEPGLPYVHHWNTTPQRVDLMVIVAHPDDELLWLGGLIPYYTAERNLTVQVCYMTCSSPTRHLELLNGLWECGVRDYPAVGKLPDTYAETRAALLKSWGEQRTLRQIVTWLRTYRPAVVVTHDINGEYGHGAHRATSWAVEQAVQLAASSDYDGGSLSLGTHQVQKVYRHLGQNPTTVLDWSTPMAAFGGRNGYEVAEAAFAKHVSQTKKNRYAVARAGHAYDSTLYTLIYTTVGEDEKGNDVFEHAENITDEWLVVTSFENIP